MAKMSNYSTTVILENTLGLEENQKRISQTGKGTACHLVNSLSGWINNGNIPLVSDMKSHLPLLIPHSLIKYSP